tara:strand:- start:29 stop:436 length:408 start_codon:yes stop_codon:yes gene_type:complete
MGDLKKWVDQKWVDIGAPKKDGKYQPCGRKSSTGSKRKYPKCVPLAKATRMTSSQKASAVKRKRAAGNPGGKPTNVATFAKRKKAADGGSMNSMMRQAQRNYTGSYVSGDLGGVKVGNKSYKKYYSNPGFRMPKI